MKNRKQELLLPTHPERIKDLLDRAGIGRWEWDIPTGVVRGDEVLAGITGWPPDAAAHIDELKTLVETRDQRRLYGVVQDMFTTGHGKIQLRIQRRDGEWRYISIDGVVEFDSEHKPQRAYGYVQDLTTLHLVEIEIEKKNDDLIIINFINEKLNCGAELKSIYQDILDWFSFQFNSCGLAIGYMNEEGNTVRIVFHSFKKNGLYSQRMEHGFPSRISIDRSALLREIIQSKRIKGVSFHEFLQDIQPTASDRQVSLLEDESTGMPNDNGEEGVWFIPLIIEDKLIGLIYVFGLGALSRTDQLRIEAISNQISGIIMRKKTEDRVRSHRKELSKLSQRLFQVQEEERRNLSLELHDELGQSLTAMRINLSAIKRAVEAVTDERTLSRINETIRIIDEKEEQIRDISLLLRPSMLDDLGLKPTLEWYIDYYKKRNKETIHFDYQLNKTVLSRDKEVVLYRVIQEALTNISRYAKAGKVSIRLLEREDGILAEIRDNGVGFNYGTFLAQRGNRKTAGLVGMHERVKMVNGSLEISSRPGEGTTIRILIPKEKEHE